MNIINNPLKFFFSVLFTLLTHFNASAQVSQQWLQRYDGGGTSDIGVGVVLDSAGNIYVTGYGGALGNSDIVTIKYSPAGQLLWSKIWNGPASSNDEPKAIIIKDNYIYITGSTESGNVLSNPRKNFVTLKYDLNGILNWSSYYNYSSTNDWEDISYAIDVSSGGDVFITGSSKDAAPGTGYRDIAIIKYDSSGRELWVTRYNAPDINGTTGTDDDIPVALKIDTASNVYVTGWSVMDTSGIDYVTLKCDSGGNILWIRRYTMPGNFNDTPSALKLDANANVYVTGASSAYAIDPSLWYDYATIKYNTNGDTIWIRRFNSAITTIPWDEARDLIVDDTGNVYVTGTAPSATMYGNDFYTIKYDSSGTLLWQSAYDGAGFGNEPKRMIMDTSGNIYITGWTMSYGSQYLEDYATIKLNNNGQLEWAETYNGVNQTEDISNDIATDNRGNIYVTGNSYGFVDDYVTIKYHEGILTSTHEINDSFYFQAFTDPYSKVIHAKIHGPITLPATMILSDLNGREISSVNITNEDQAVLLTCPATGIYLIKLFSGINYQINKIIVTD